MRPGGSSEIAVKQARRNRQKDLFKSCAVSFPWDPDKRRLSSPPGWEVISFFHYYSRKQAEAKSLRCGAGFFLPGRGHCSKRAVRISAWPVATHCAPPREKTAESGIFRWDAAHSFHRFVDNKALLLVN